MGLLSSIGSLTRYKVEGKLEEPVLETVAAGLRQNSISEIDEDVSEKAVGWTSFSQPFAAEFEGSSFVIGTFLIFSLRIDRKSIPPKVIKKHIAMEKTKRLAESGRAYLSKEEKNLVKDHVMDVLSLRIPSTPNIYDLIWNLEEGWLWFFSNMKNANEELETLFIKSFKLSLIRLFPYTMAGLTAGLSDSEKDVLNQLSFTHFGK
ncbi:MAG: recombination-associated protein RdgC [Desulfobacterales bacterium]|nr:recombination-associated protein RdgC [Desulfobacterales bacterium]